MKPGIYIVSSEHSKLTGMASTCDLERVLSTLQAQSAVKLTMAGTIPTDSWPEARALEQRLVRKLSKCRAYGHWYEAEPDILKAVAQVVMNQTKEGSKEKQIEKEAEWRKQGRFDHDSNVPLNDPLRVGKPYSTTWYKAQNAWEIGWKEARKDKQGICD